MKRSCLTTVMLALVAACLSPCLAGRVTTDPNAGAAKPAVATQSGVDARLAQLVTYEGGYKRLHYAIEEISAKTGVNIRCGANNQDWQVRDLPLVFAATQMPLGRLLEAIASAANLELISETIKSDSGRSERQYRLSLTSRARTALDNALTEKYQAGIEREGRMWDALVASADVPDSDLDASTGWARSARILGQILKELGPDAKAKALSGQKTELNAKNFAKPELLQQLGQATAEQFRSALSAVSGAETAEIAPCTLTIQANNDPATGNFSINTTVPVQEGKFMMAPSLPLDMAANQVWRSVKGHDKPTVLQGPPPEVKIADHMSRDLIPLDTKSDAEPAPAFLRQKTNLELPKDRDVTYAEAISAIAKAAGLNIIAEDYLDHKRPMGIQWKSGSGGTGTTVRFSTSTIGSSKGTPPGKISDMIAAANTPQAPFSPLSSLGKDATVSDALRTLTKSEFGAPQFEWFCNEKAKLLVARPLDWIKKHGNLMPEAVLVELKNKALADGLELDDICHLAAYTQPQLNEWVYMSKDLGFIMPMICSSQSRAIWSLYDKLSADDKALARSDVGLPLAKFDSQWIADFLKTRVESDNTIRLTSTTGIFAQKPRDSTKDTAILTDPEAVRALTLKVVKKPSQIHMMSSSAILTDPKAIAQSGDWHTYGAQLKGQYKDQPVDMELEAPYFSFPIYSPEREAELTKKQDKEPNP